MDQAPDVLRTLAERFDASAFDSPSGHATLRLRVTGEGDWDATVRDGAMELAAADGARPDARLAADAATWHRIADDVRGGMEAFSRGGWSAPRPAPRRRLPRRHRGMDRRRSGSCPAASRTERGESR